MKIIVSASQSQETIDDFSDVSSANNKILDAAFNLQNFTLKELEKIECDSDDEINLLLFYDKRQNIRWTVQKDICSNCKAELKRILETPVS